MGSELMMNEENSCGKSVLLSIVLGPATPDENGEHSHDYEYNFSPDSAELETPKETLFDSFAPASDKFLLAPHGRKYREESRNLVVRRLDFRNETTADDEEETRLFEIVYSAIMDAIFAEAAADPSTPRSAPLVAETCPAAPVKPKPKPARKQQRCIDKEICKKLEF